MVLLESGPESRMMAGVLFVVGMRPLERGPDGAA
jgi:hypothetical protein